MLKVAIVLACLLSALCVVSGCEASNKSGSSGQASNTDAHHDMLSDY